MPINREQVATIVQAAIEELNAQVPEDQQVGIAPDTLLLGRESNLDSLGLVTLIYSIEKKIDATFGLPIVIGNELMSAGVDSPIRTVQGMIDYVTQQLTDSQVR